MMQRITISFLLLLMVAPCLSQWTSHRPDGHAPLGVMGDHTHHAGEFMISYRLMYMKMDGNRDGSERIDAAQVVSPSGNNFVVTPLKMPMQMHMVGLMYAPTDNLTLMAMMPFTSLEMDHRTRAGGQFTTESSGPGDLKLTALFVLSQFGNQRIHFNAGLSLPIGSIEEKDVTPASAPNETVLPYPMQIGSGTFDLRPGLTYLGQKEMWSWGGQALLTIRLGKNASDYRLGNQLQGTLWGAYEISRVISFSGRLAGSTVGNIDGANPAFAAAVQMRMVPTVFTDLQGGKRVDAGLGINFYLPEGALHGFRLGVEALFPVYQNLNGPQLETDLRLIAGTQYAF